MEGIHLIQIDESDGPYERGDATLTLARCVARFGAVPEAPSATHCEGREHGMSGIVAVRGRRAASDVLVRLKGLEYRGYESAGLAELAADHSIHVARSIGPIDALIDRIAHENRPATAGRLAIGHTRWATHGTVAVRNVDPLSDCDHRVTVVHNGTLDNAADLRRELEGSGHRFESDVDSEVIPHLIEQGLVDGATAFEAFQSAVRRLRGTWAIAALIARSNAIYLARQRLPLMVRGTVGRFAAASDATATAGVRGPLRIFEDGTIAELGTQWRWAGSAAKGPAPVVLTDDAHPASAGWCTTAAATWDHALNSAVADIDEQGRLVERLVAEMIEELPSPRLPTLLGPRTPNRIVLLGCGASHHAAQVAARVVRIVARIDACAVVASEFDKTLVAPFDVVVAFSESGQTAHLLAALDQVDTPVLAITGHSQSPLARRANAVIDTHVGRERGAAAMKTFTSQVLCGIRFALNAAIENGLSSRARRAASLLAMVPHEFSAAIEQRSPISDNDARVLAAEPGWVFLGTGASLPYAAEGALKLNELGCRWAASIPAAELTHGPLALVAQGAPAVLIDDGTPRCATARSELLARGARVITLGPPRPTSTEEFGRQVPWGPLDVVPRLQYLALSIAGARRQRADRHGPVATSTN